MTPPRPTLDATNQADDTARIAAVALAVFVAIAVAALFLVFIGADRSDRLVAPSSDGGQAQPAKTQALAFPLSTLGLGGALGTSQNRARAPRLTTNTTHEKNKRPRAKARKGKEEK